MDKLKKLPEIRRGAGKKPEPEKRGLSLSNENFAMPKVVASARFASLADQQLSGSKPLRSSDLMASEMSLDSPAKDRIFGRNRNSQNSFQIKPTNYELELMNYQNETGEVKSLFDFTSKNIGDLKSFKIGKL